MRIDPWQGLFKLHDGRFEQPNEGHIKFTNRIVE